jgi:hypothetical protein
MVPASLEGKACNAVSEFCEDVQSSRANTKFELVLGKWDLAALKHQVCVGAHVLSQITPLRSFYIEWSMSILNMWGKYPIPVGAGLTKGQQRFSWSMFGNLGQNLGMSN